MIEIDLGTNDFGLIHAAIVYRIKALRDTQAAGSDRHLIGAYEELLARALAAMDTDYAEYVC